MKRPQGRGPNLQCRGRAGQREVWAAVGGAGLWGREGQQRWRGVVAGGGGQAPPEEPPGVGFGEDGLVCGQGHAWGPPGVSRWVSQAWWEPWPIEAAVRESFGF